MNDLENLQLLTLALCLLLILMIIVCIYLLKENIRLREEHDKLQSYCRQLEDKAWKLMFGIK